MEKVQWNSINQKQNELVQSKNRPPAPVYYNTNTIIEYAIQLINYLLLSIYWLRFSSRVTRVRYAQVVASWCGSRKVVVRFSDTAGSFKGKQR